MNATSAGEEDPDEQLLLGIVLTLLGAATLALSMVMQRYALSYPEPKVPLLCCRPG